ncbi:hypothetical protein M3Y98_01014600 [Aphelenchoides besseyi]|nr:hypothetical protein M3Y98_01014600 [Aphelenchoides besseyi]KAI6210130.1 hypothetical protein M3Y96_00295200 [Aphelenchoides besseyi]
MENSSDFLEDAEDMQLLQQPTHQSPTLAGGAAVYGMPSSHTSDYAFPVNFLETPDPNSVLMETDQQHLMNDPHFGYGNSMAGDGQQMVGEDYSTWQSNPYYDQQAPQTYDYYTAGPSTTMVDNPFEEEETYEEDPEEQHQMETTTSNIPQEQTQQPQTLILRYANRAVPPPAGPRVHIINRNIQRPKQFPEIRRVVSRPREFVDESLSHQDVAEKARLQSAQRLTTLQGWNQFEKWLKPAIENNDCDKIIHLLKTCKLAKITFKLLRHTETPKLVKKLSKTHPNETIKALSTKLVKNWTEIVREGNQMLEKKETAKKADSTAKTEMKAVASTTPASQPEKSDVNLIDQLTDAMDKNMSSSSDPTPPVIKHEETPKPTKTRTKAKVKLSKGRSTGLEGDLDDAPPSKQAISSGRKPVAQQKKPVPLLHGIDSEQQTSNADKLKISRVKPSLSSSDAFLNAFNVEAKRAGGRPKLTATRVPRLIPLPNEVPVDVKPSLPITTNNSETREPIVRKPNPGGGILRREALTESEKKTRKIRFADDYGMELEEVKEFASELNERVNVTKQQMIDMDTDMKHSDMMREGELMRQSKTLDWNDGAAALDEAMNAYKTIPNAQQPSSPGPTTSSARILDPRQLPLPNVANLSPRTKKIHLERWPGPKIERGHNSLLVELERKREETAMASFINPTAAIVPHNEEDQELLNAADESKNQNLLIIPLQTIDPSTSAINSATNSIVNTLTITTPRTSVLDLPLPFSSTSQPTKPTDHNSVIELLSGVQMSASLTDQDFRADVKPSFVDQDYLQSSLATEAPKSPPMNPMNSSDNNNTAAGSKANLTMTEISRLATIAGRNPIDNLTSGIDLAAILNKVESAQMGSASTNEPPSGSTSGSIFDTLAALNSYSSSSNHYAQEEGAAMPSTAPNPTFNAYLQPGTVPHFGSSPTRSTVNFRPRFPPTGIRPITPRGAFFHNPPPGGYGARRAPTITCRFWKQGTCRNGETCKFLHGDAPVRGSAVPTAPMPISPTKDVVMGNVDELNPNMMPVNANSMAAQFGSSGSSFSTEGFRGSSSARGYRGRNNPRTRGGDDRGRGRRHDRNYETRRSPPRRRRSRSLSRDRSRSPLHSGRRNRSRSSSPRRSSSRSPVRSERRRGRQSAGRQYSSSSDRSPPRNVGAADDHSRSSSPQTAAEMSNDIRSPMPVD